MIIKHIFSILSYVLGNRLLRVCQRLMHAVNALIISEICRLCTLSIVWKRMGNVWKMGQGVWNISTVIYFAK